MTTRKLNLFYSLCALVGVISGCAATQAVLNPNEPKALQTLEVRFTDPVKLSDDDGLVFVCSHTGGQFLCVEYRRFHAVLEQQQRPSGTEL